MIESKIQAIKWNYPERYKKYTMWDYVRMPQSPASPVARSVKSFTPPVGSVRGVDVYCGTCEKHTGGNRGKSPQLLTHTQRCKHQPCDWWREQKQQSKRGKALHMYIKILMTLLTSLWLLLVITDLCVMQKRILPVTYASRCQHVTMITRVILTLKAVGTSCSHVIYGGFTWFPLSKNSFIRILCLRLK